MLPKYRLFYLYPLCCASILTLKDTFLKDEIFDLNIILSIIFSYLFSYLTIKYFLIYMKKFSLNLFVIYRILIFNYFLLYLFLAQGQSEKLKLPIQ